jgi:hypothetical protein
MASLLSFRKKKKGDEADHSHDDVGGSAVGAEKDDDDDSGYGGGVVPGSQYTASRKERQLNDSGGVGRGRGRGRASKRASDDEEGGVGGGEPEKRVSRSVSISRAFRRMVGGVGRRTQSKDPKDAKRKLALRKRAAARKEGEEDHLAEAKDGTESGDAVSEDPTGGGGGEVAKKKLARAPPAKAAAPAKSPTLAPAPAEPDSPGKVSPGEGVKKKRLVAKKKRPVINKETGEVEEVLGASIASMDLSDSASGVKPKLTRGPSGSRTASAKGEGVPPGKRLKKKKKIIKR